MAEMFRDLLHNACEPSAGAVGCGGYAVPTDLQTPLCQCSWPCRTRFQRFAGDGGTQTLMERWAIENARRTIRRMLSRSSSPTHNGSLDLTLIGIGHGVMPAAAKALVYLDCFINPQTVKNRDWDGLYQYQQV